MKKIPFEESFFSFDNERSFYWAGFLAADSYLADKISQVSKTSKSHRKTIRITVIDKEIIEKFLFDIKCIGRKITENHYATRKGVGSIYGIELSSFKMFDDLQRFGLSPSKTFTLEMPEWLKSHPLNNHFIRGYFDGGGSIYVQRNSKYIEFRGTVPFLNSLNEIIKSNINILTVAVPHVHSNCGSLKYSGNLLVAEVGNFLYKEATIWLDRKRLKVTA